MTGAAKLGVSTVARQVRSPTAEAVSVGRPHEPISTHRNLAVHRTLEEEVYAVFVAPFQGAVLGASDQHGAGSVTRGKPVTSNDRAERTHTT